MAEETIEKPKGPPGNIQKRAVSDVVPDSSETAPGPPSHLMARRPSSLELISQSTIARRLLPQPAEHVLHGIATSLARKISNARADLSNLGRRDAHLAERARDIRERAE